MTISPDQTLEVPDVCHRWLENRGAIYELLIDFLGQWPTLSLVAEWSRGSGIGKAAELSQGGQELRNYLSNRSPEELVRISEYEEAEYRRLLAYSKQRPLTETKYTKRGNAQDLAEFYASVGVAFKKLEGEADDYIAIELEFMTLLHDRMMNNTYCEDSMIKLMEIQEKFLQDHLLTWIPSFCQDLRTATDSPLYQSLSRLLEEFLVQDLHMLRTWRQHRDVSRIS
ncbi:MULTISPECIES: TorD/DmsD family molecular chaperone [Paenibacillus]|uniref:Molecular chaperone TorD n=1 Tax=Paenibacillus campinasensis TaxID=66347 RepID=A0A268EVW2_9BACL|nr:MULTISPECIES: molecular chaperone TorD family protein [Paenibacillus]MUG67548.1 hypothetical protein [Paenibacillus campinasensis]PAD77260.1 hypothetical protein CHH67_09630 [Paenibacillus campinasensis]PAK52096.1 hypothetical protein CHH75_12820 [Paenibacillus sp. 7541]